MGQLNLKIFFINNILTKFPELTGWCIQTTFWVGIFKTTISLWHNLAHGARLCPKDMVLLRALEVLWVLHSRFSQKSSKTLRCYYVQCTFILYGCTCTVCICIIRLYSVHLSSPVGDG